MKPNVVSEKQMLFYWEMGQDREKRQMEFDKVNEFAEKERISENFGLSFMEKSVILGVL